MFSEMLYSFKKYVKEHLNGLIKNEFGNLPVEVYVSMVFRGDDKIYLVYASHCAEHLTSIISFNYHNNNTR